MKFKILLWAALAWTSLDCAAAVRMPAQSPAQPAGSGPTASTEQPATSQAASPAAGAQAPVSPAQVSGLGAPPMIKAQVLALLYKIYQQAYQFSDAVSKLQPDDWKFGGRKRLAFYQSSASVQASVTSLRKPWDDFNKQPDDAALGGATLSAVQALLTQANDFMAALADSPGASHVPDFKPMVSGLGDLEHQLEPYVTYLQASAQPPPTAATVASSSAAPSQPAPTAAPVQPAVPSNNPSQPPATSAAPAATTTTQPSGVAENTAGQPAAPASAPAAANAPAAPPAAAQPAPAEAAATPTPAVTPVPMQPNEAQALLYKIYAAAFRIGDLANALQTDKWTMSDQDKAAFAGKLDALHAGLADAEKWRSDFYNHPEDADVGRSTDSALQAVTPKLDDLIAALSTAPASASASDFKQAGSDLAALDQHLDSYVAYLVAKEQPPAAPGAGGVTLETEEITHPEAVAPLTSAVIEKAPEDQEQLKTMLYKAYIPAFRIKDMLAQEHPGQWPASQADRTAFDDSAKALSDRIADVEKWRDQLEAHPESLEAAFEAYASLGKLVDPADVVGRLEGQYGNAKIGAEYGQRAQQVADSRDQLEPYLEYLLRHHDHAVGTIERNFVTCESQLSYAMRPTTPEAVSLKNVNPVFQGRGKRTARASHSAGSKKNSAHTDQKQPSKPAAPGPGR